ncbi:MAG: anthranilate synthase component I family protein [Candidatus Omnitrophica bacterium]|nr:anthranilate synthase component I family protein [Candidatus Omnitrophota bacterium]
MQIIPDYSIFKKLGRKGNLAAVMAQIPADLETPVSAFLKLASALPHAFLLESAEQQERIGRFSIIGLRPRKVITADFSSKDFLASLKTLLQGLQLANAEDVPGFSGGLVGFMSYERVREFETIHLKSKNGPRIPEGIFHLSQELVIFDHFQKSLFLVDIVDISRGASRSVYRKALRRIRHRIHALNQPLKIKPKKSHPPRSVHPHSNIQPSKFYEKVKKIKTYIRAGDCIQVVLSQRFALPLIQDDFQIYRALRSINPSPYMFYFRSGKIRLIGSSPEMLVKKTGRLAEVRPIAGTRPRGADEAEDICLEESLKKSPKEMAEHLMLVDLGRNDLGRVCEFSSVKVKDFARVERYSHVMHLVTDVIGKLKLHHDAFDLLKAAFPAGTVTGAPKIRAMQIIDELETQARGPYAGSLGYFGFNGDMDMCLTIRTLFTDGKKFYLQAGAGIVKDSDPKREFQETVNKAKALIKAIEIKDQF